MNLLLTTAIFLLRAGAVSASAAPAARTPQLLWEQVYDGSAGGFDWAHRLSLDSSDGMLYAVGKTSETFGSQSLSVIWTQATRSAWASGVDGTGPRACWAASGSFGTTVHER